MAGGRGESFKDILKIIGKIWVYMLNATIVLWLCRKMYLNLTNAYWNMCYCKFWNLLLNNKFRVKNLWTTKLYNWKWLKWWSLCYGNFISKNKHEKSCGCPTTGSCHRTASGAWRSSGGTEGGVSSVTCRHPLTPWPCCFHTETELEGNAESFGRIER